MVGMVTHEAPVLHAVRVDLPLPVDTAVAIVGFGLFVFAIIAYDMYRYYNA